MVLALVIGQQSNPRGQHLQLVLIRICVRLTCKLLFIDKVGAGRKKKRLPVFFSWCGLLSFKLIISYCGKCFCEQELLSPLSLPAQAARNSCAAAQPSGSNFCQVAGRF